MASPTIMGLHIRASCSRTGLYSPQIQMKTADRNCRYSRNRLRCDRSRQNRRMLHKPPDSTCTFAGVVGIFALFNGGALSKSASWQHFATVAKSSKPAGVSTISSKVMAETKSLGRVHWVNSQSRKFFIFTAWRGSPCPERCRHRPSTSIARVQIPSGTPAQQKAFSLAEQDDPTRFHQRSAPVPAYPGCEFVGPSAASTSRPTRAMMSGTASTSA